MISIYYIYSPLLAKISQYISLIRRNKTLSNKSSGPKFGSDYNPQVDKIFDQGKFLNPI